MREFVVNGSSSPVIINQTMSQFSELVSYSRPMLVAAGVITLITMVIGVIGNLLTMVALIRFSKIRTVAAAFIGNLCVSDLLFCFLVLPFAASQFFNGEWIHGKFLCYLIPLLRYGSVGVSLLSVATISINRYILIAWPQLYSRVYTKTKVCIYIAVIWIFSYGLLIPTLIGVWGKFGFDKKIGTCSIIPDDHDRTSKTFLFVMGFALPCVIICICYAIIYFVVKRSHERVQQYSSSAGHKRSEMDITKMVLLIFFCFIVCYLPLTAVKVFDENVSQPPLHVIAYILLYFSACINPVVYVTMNRQYRRAYFQTLTCKLSAKLDSNTTPVQNSKTMSVVFAKNIINNPKV